MTKLTYRIGIDLGGTKMEGIRLSSSGDILQRERLPTPSGDYGATLQQVAHLVDHLALDPTVPVGIGTPGSRSRASGLIRNANSTCLNGRPLLEDLTELLQREVRIANDADCFTLSEAADGAGQATHTVFGVILGTGVGGGICVNGELLGGINGITGEWGHNPLPAPVSGSRDCYCGRSNCIETWLSGPGLSISYQAATGELIPARAIAELLARGEAAATDVIEQYCQQHWLWSSTSSTRTLSFSAVGFQISICFTSVSPNCWPHTYSPIMWQPASCLRNMVIHPASGAQRGSGPDTLN